jgi:hypothetical protein
MSWYYNSNTGLVDQTNDLIGWQSLHAGLGWHGPFKTEQAAMDYYNANKGKNPGWVKPTTSKLDAINPLPANPLDQLGNIDLTSWFIRVGEILLGIVLIGVGIAKLTGTTNAVSNLVKARIP